MQSRYEYTLVLTHKSRKRYEACVDNSYNSATTRLGQNNTPQMQRHLEMKRQSKTAMASHLVFTESGSYGRVIHDK
jgi:hypothetical protein